MSLPTFKLDIPLAPGTTPAEQVKAAIIAAMLVYANPAWQQWAQSWLLGNHDCDYVSIDPLAHDCEKNASHNQYAAHYATCAAWKLHVGGDPAYYAAWAIWHSKK